MGRQMDLFELSFSEQRISRISRVGTMCIMSHGIVPKEYSEAGYIAVAVRYRSHRYVLRVVVGVPKKIFLSAETGESTCLGR